MKFLSIYSVRPGCQPETEARFLAGKGQHGISLVETDDAAAMHAYAAEWGDVLQIHTHTVVEDATAGESLGKRYGAK